MQQMNLIGKAIKQYQTDWDDTYPVNQSLGKSPVQMSEISLSDVDTASGEPKYRFQYGVNWVESLNPYIEKLTEGEASPYQLQWVCPEVAKTSRHDFSASSAVSYALNQSFLGRRDSVIRLPGSTMMLREMDRPCGAVCRPIVSYDETSRPSIAGAFLSGSDPVYGNTVSVLHRPGSNILFADGHVKTNYSSPMPRDTQLYFDKSRNQWYNVRTREIAVTP
jgi:prepilin-type processing-associated H-X9-DG protein